MIITRVAVLLAAYNGEKWIEEQVKTILKQKGIDLRLYVSVDLSTDNTYKIVCELSQKYPEIIVLPYGRRFGSAAPNFYNLLLTVPIEKYEYIALSDQDDIWLDGKITRAVCVLENQKAFGYSSNAIAFWSDGKKKIIKKAYRQTKYDYLFESPGPGCTFVLKKQLALSLCEYLKRCACLDTLDWHDWIIYAYARTNNYKWIIDASSYILYRQHNNNQLGANVGIKAFFDRIKSIISGYGINQSVKIIEFLHLEDNEFVAAWLNDNKIRYMTLAMQSNKCRRKIDGKILFFFACIIMSIIKPKIIEQ
jgi:rhamnosyltransferase